MFRKTKRRFFRRPSRRGVKRDVLSLSVTDEIAITRSAVDPIIGLFNPFADALVLCTGSPETQAISATQASATPLQRDGGRGASISSIQFDWAGFTTCWLNTGSPNANGEQEAFLVRHYMAFVKAKFDMPIYETTGEVVPTWNQVPNIILSPRDVATTSVKDPLFDPPVEIFWRGYQEALAHNCFVCPPCGCTPSACTGFPTGENCSNCGSMAGPQWFIGTVNMPSGMVANQSLANNYNMRHVKLRSRRFLKEDECLVLVSNWVTNIPANSEVIWDRTLFGTAAVRIAR